MKTSYALGATLALLLCSPGVFAAGEEKAAPPAVAGICFGCHGGNGISMSGVWPNLAGQKEPYLIKQLKDFRSGTRKDPMMEPLTKHLTDEQITELARYFSSQAVNGGLK
ncbi:cytochrome c [Parahaliea maris]|uniref:Cytochrome c n=1 Tax=Parahaliea maris TaxID=2716870 RepID=A0A5C8ZU39_9GAMM|nr:c-type cytochrome [Parahaliea maris]TXS92008.1 cytochrome c [Parahaliea maris]